MMQKNPGTAWSRRKCSLLPYTVKEPLINDLPSNIASFVCYNHLAIFCCICDAHKLSGLRQSLPEQTARPSGIRPVFRQNEHLHLWYDFRAVFCFVFSLCRHEVRSKLCERVATLKRGTWFLGLSLRSLLSHLPKIRISVLQTVGHGGYTLILQCTDIEHIINAFKLLDLCKYNGIF